MSPISLLPKPVQGRIYKDARILIVDDQPANVALLTRLLEENGGYTHLKGITDPREVFLWVADFEPDLILLDLSMPELDGFKVMEQLELLIPEEHFLPILVLTADITAETKQRALALGANDFLTKPFDSTEVLLRIRNLLQTRYLHQHLEHKVRERTQELEQAQMEILERLALSAEYRDDDTGQHIQRVAQLSATLARNLGLSERQVELIRRAAPLHDVGKIGIPDSILLKPGKIDAHEFEQIKAHTWIGAKILSNGRSDLVRLAEQIALTHHERWDGKGYPRGLSGEDIPLVGRIVSVVDVFDALTHERPYKKAWSVGEALEMIETNAGRQFDPRVARAFLEMMKTEKDQPQLQV